MSADHSKAERTKDSYIHRLVVMGCSARIQTNADFAADGHGLLFAAVCRLVPDTQIA